MKIACCPATGISFCNGIQHSAPIIAEGEEAPVPEHLTRLHIFFAFNSCNLYEIMFVNSDYVYLHCKAGIQTRMCVRAEAPVTDHLRDSVLGLEKYKVV